MAKTQIDTGRLFAVLEARTTDENLSWRQAATQIGVSPSLLSRLRYGQRPDLDGYASIVRWLRMSADDFIVVEGDDMEPGGEVSLITEISALLRKRRDLSDSDKTYLEDVLTALDKDDLHWAFYSFREDAWDGMDYELGSKTVGWKYWQQMEANERDTTPRTSTPEFAPISRRLAEDE